MDSNRGMEHKQYAGNVKYKRAQAHRLGSRPAAVYCIACQLIMYDAKLQHTSACMHVRCVQMDENAVSRPCRHDNVHMIDHILVSNRVFK